MFSRDACYITDRIEYASDGTPTIYLTEVSYGQEAELGERGNQQTLSVDRGRQQESSSESHPTEVQRLSEQNSGDVEMQPISERDSEGDSEEQGTLQGVQAEVKASESENTNDAYSRLAGSNFSDNTLRWQLAMILFRMICGVDDKHGNSLYFFDYWKGGKGKGDHRDFYGNERYIHIFCDLCRGEKTSFSEYDREAIAEMIKKGYVIKDGEAYRVTVPIYTSEQYRTIIHTVKEFISAELVSIVREMDKTAARILSAHTPKQLYERNIQSQPRTQYLLFPPYIRAEHTL